MRVNDRTPAESAAIGADRTQEAARAERGDSLRAAARSGSSSDRVELSGVTRALHASAAAHSEHIAKLAAAHHQGRYTVNPAQVSQAIVNDALLGVPDK
jgi:anti-sigma28 factor (negative regulator of flagellin synthesis)